MDENRPDEAKRDVELMTRIQRRDAAALAALYDERSGLVYSLALRIVGNEADAEEVTVDVFQRIWERADAYTADRGSPMAWIVTMTRRLAIDRTRSRLYRSRAAETELDGDAGAGQGVGVPGTAAESIEVTVEAGEILDALDQLGPLYGDVIRLSYYEGLSHAMIAERLALPLGTVKSRLREGVTKLRQLLKIKTP